MDPRTPNLFIIGAPNACTGFVDHSLGLVSDVYKSTGMEPGYVTSTSDHRRGLDHYLDAYFPEAKGYALRGKST